MLARCPADVLDCLGRTGLSCLRFLFHLHSPTGHYDEPEILSYEIPLVCSIGADVGQSERNDKTAGWLKHAIWIAAHTGAREGAIAALEYDADQKTIRFPKAKKEKDDRIVPAHPAIEANLEAWVSGQRRSASSISNQFTKFKQSLGYGVSQDFHSFRRTLITLLENAGIAENVTADIVGHKKPRISYGLYSSGNEIEVMREAVEKIDYKSKGQKILT